MTATLRDLDWAMASSGDDPKRVEQSYLRYAGAGLEFFVTVAVLTLSGVWLDDRFGTSPVLTIVLTFVGFASATWMLVRSVSPSPGGSHKRDDHP